MMITFLAQGRGNIHLAVRYCAGDIDANGMARDEVRVLRGSPKMVEDVAAALPFTEKYKSAVIAWAPGDIPTEAELQQLLDDFAEVSFAGLEPTRFCWTAFLHVAPHKMDLHILVANVDLGTGKHFNIAPPGWQKDFDPLRDIWNHRMGWARPDDPLRARPWQPGKRSSISAARVRAGLEVEPDTKKVLGEMLLDRVVRGVVKNRAEVLAALKEFGEITRAGDDFISVKPPNLAKAVRLRGALFHKDFDASTFVRPAPSPVRTDKDREADINPEEEEAARKRFTAAIARRAAVNEHRYRLTARRAARNRTTELTRAATDAAPEPLLDLSGTGPPPSEPAIPASFLPETHAAQGALPHDRTPLVLREMLENLVRGIRRGVDRLARAIGQAAGRLGRHSKGNEALNAIARATLDSTGAKKPAGPAGAARAAKKSGEVKP
ncbi:hypothetical protein [Polaromonas sp. DSR2-3-2]|uniref:hypothetical protein n=1 Tax=unclassified Polaromonas TaxID=2638319 RepID=UPI003CF1B27F